MKFTWDTVKADTNLQKHGVNFDEAATVFGDALAGTFSDVDHSLPPSLPHRVTLHYRRYVGQWTICWLCPIQKLLMKFA